MRWKWLSTSTNDAGATFASLCCFDPGHDDGDLREFLSVLKDQFGAVETGRVQGPHSLRVEFLVMGLRLGVILETPGWIDLDVRTRQDRPTLELLATRIVESLKAPEI